MRLARPAAVGLLVATALLTGCQHARNHLDPRRPAYAGNHSPGRASRPSPATLRIVTFNVEYALKVDRALVALRDHPRLRGADLVALQEMDAPGTERIARALGLNYVYYPASVHPKHRRDVGNAILTPWPIEASFKLPLPHRSRLLGQSRAAVVALVRVDGLRMRVYSLHLGSPLGASGGQRRDQIQVVLCDARESPDPVILAGDFNSKGIAGGVAAAGYSWLTRGVGSTTRIFSYDHVLVRGLAFDEAAAGVARDVRDASDHRPVWAELTGYSTPKDISSTGMTQLNSSLKTVGSAPAS